MKERRVRKLAPKWESRVGETTLRWGAASWVRLKLGWLIGVIGCGVVVPLIWSGAPNTVTFPLGLMVLVLSVSVMVPAVSAARRQVKATMQHLGLPEKPGVTVQALQSPAAFDQWLLETREYHHLVNDKWRISTVLASPRRLMASHGDWAPVGSPDFYLVTQPRQQICCSPSLGFQLFSPA